MLEAPKMKVGFKEVELEDPFLLMDVQRTGVVPWPGVSVFYGFHVKVSQTSVWLKSSVLIHSCTDWKSRCSVGPVPWQRNGA